MTCLRLIACILLSLPLSATGRFEYTPQAREAYEKVMSLRFGEAHALLAGIKLKDPGNLVVYHIEDYIDFFTLYIGENEADYARLKRKREERLAQMEGGDPASPYYLFTQADIRLHWALVRLRFGEYFAAFTEVNKANKLLEKNRKKFPDFMPNLKDLGILHAMVGTIPDSYRWGIRILSSLQGSLEQGRQEMETVLAYARDRDFIFADETRALYAYLLLHLEHRPDAAWKAINAGTLQPARNPLHCFVMANIAMRSERNDEAVRLLEGRPQGQAFHPFPYLHFMLGEARLRRLDPDAGPHFRHFLSVFKGRHYIKESYQKLAWQELINGDPVGYRRQMVKCLEQGQAVAGGDINAQREAEAGRTPPIELIQARLLFDGGYYQRAYDLLQKKDGQNFSDAYHRLEYSYRLGRILHGLQRYDEAMQIYRQTIEAGKDTPYFFACNAALQSGLICETRREWEQAREYFQLCLKLNPEDYATGLHQQAKAGLARTRR